MVTKVSLQVSKEDFKLVKKNRKNIIIQLRNDENEKIEVCDKLCISVAASHKSLKRKVKKVSIYSSLEELKNEQGYKEKIDDLVKDLTESDIKKHGLIVIEIKKKNHLFRNIFLGILMIIPLLCFLLYFNIKVSKFKAHKFNSNLNNLMRERIDYVFIEINPSFVLTVKANQTVDFACLNDDCISIYDDIDIKDKNIDESIDTIYQVSKENGFDVSKGVKVKSSNPINIDTKDYILYERIDISEQQELIKEVKNNEDIKNVNNGDYYDTLWNELKKDSDYDLIYSCAMEDGELQCFFTEKFLTADEKNNYNGLRSLGYNSIQRVYDKFGIKYETWMYGVYGIYIDEKFYYIVNMELTHYDNLPECEEYKNDMPTAYITCTNLYSDKGDVRRVPLGRLNLLTGKYDKKDVL